MTQTDWLEAELMVTYNVKQTTRLEEGHGMHLVCEDEHQIKKLEIYLGDNIIDISDKIKDIEKYL